MSGPGNIQYTVEIYNIIAFCINICGVWAPVEVDRVGRDEN